MIRPPQGANLAAAVLIATGCVWLDAEPVRAQGLLPPVPSADAPLGLRRTSSQVPDGTAPASPPSTARVARRGATKRNRPPTILPVQSAVRTTLSSPDVAAAVQPPLTGLPDPSLAPTGPVGLRRRLAEDDPYAPLGVRVGNVVVQPALGQSIGYDSNPNRVDTNRRGSVVSQTELEVGLRSDWSNHELVGALRGAYNEYPSNPEASRPEAAGRIGLRLDATRNDQIDIGARFQVDTQRPGSPDLNVSVRERPIVASEGVTLGYTHRFNRLLASISGTVDRVDYDDVRLSNGTTLDQGDRDLTQFGLRGRLGYELNPGLIPFVEILADTRVYDLRRDSAGLRRSSDGIGGRAGTTFEFSRLLTGEIGVGAIQRRYEDPRLGTLVSPLLDAALTWSVTPLTTVRATAQATVDETTVGGANGVQALRGGVEVTHALRRYLTVTAGLTGSNYDYQGTRISEQGFGALLRADYRFTRWLSLRASYNHEHLWSSLAGSSYTADVFLLGMRFTP